MAQQSVQQSVRRRASITICSFVCIVSAFTETAKADFSRDIRANDTAESATLPSLPRYFRPVEPSAPRSPSTTTGTRSGGCFNSDQSPFLLAPTRFIGETATAFPTFTWFLPDDESVPVEFSLYAIQPSGLLELQHSVTLAYESGIGQYQLPAQTAMESDQSYLWQLILYCNPNRPSQSLVYEAEVILRSSPAPVTFAGSAINQSKALAEAGYWYDAIAVLGNQQTPEVSELRSILLSDVARLEDAMTENAAAAEPVE